jgi:hypothetical protein
MFVQLGTAVVFWDTAGLVSAHTAIAVAVCCYCYQLLDSWEWMEQRNVSYVMWWRNLGMQLETFVLFLQAKWTAKGVELSASMYFV